MDDACPDQAEILNVIGSFAQRADRRDWEGLVGCFTEMVDRDYSSLTGSGPDRLAARKLVVEEWAPVLGSLDATQHLIGLPVVSLNGDSATATAHFQAEVLSQRASEDSVVDVHRGWGEHRDAKLDINWVLYYRIRGGKIAEVQNFAGDQHAADLFFWEVWGESLKPLPDRLSDA